MSALEHYDTDVDVHESGPDLGVLPDAVEIRRNAVLMGVVGATAGALAVAWATRVVGGGSLVEWLAVIAMAGVAVFYLGALADARTPLLVADDQGMRIRLGRTWRGLPWSSLAQVEVDRRYNWLRDGRVALVPQDLDGMLEGLDGAGRRQTRWSQLLHGSPLAIPVGLSTSVRGSSGDDLAADLQALARGRADVVELDLEDPGEEPDEDGYLADDELDSAPEDSDQDEPHPRFLVAAHSLPVDLDDDSADEQIPGQTSAAAGDADAREPVQAVVVEVADDPDAGEDGPEPTRPVVLSKPAALARKLRVGRREQAELEPAGDDEPEGETTCYFDVERSWGERIRPISRPGQAVEPLVIEEPVAEPAADPVIGPELVAARTRLGISVDQLADRTRIRPHVIESIEVDDFAPCGGDFYARGHLRTLARVLGIDAAPLLSHYDERYANAPVDAKAVFEADLASSGGSIRGTKGGPNWSVLIAVVMALILAWSVARLVMDSPVDLGSRPELNGSGGPGGREAVGDPIPLMLRASGGGTHVVVRDGTGKEVFSGDLSYGASRSLSVVPPIRVESSDGSLEVTVDGEDRGPVGKSGEDASQSYVSR